MNKLTVEQVKEIFEKIISIVSMEEDPETAYDEALYHLDTSPLGPNLCYLVEKALDKGEHPAEYIEEELTWSDYIQMQLSFDNDMVA